MKTEKKIDLPATSLLGFSFSSLLSWLLFISLVGWGFTEEPNCTGAGITGSNPEVKEICLSHFFWFEII